MFKNLSVYRFESMNLFNDWQKFFSDNQPCLPTQQQTVTFGWEMPDEITMETISDLTIHVYDWILPLKLIIHQRVINTKAIELQLRLKIEEIEKKENRVVGKKEKISIKDELIFSEIPKAPIVQKVVKGYICPLVGFGRIYVDAVGKLADDYISFLIKTLSGEISNLLPWTPDIANYENVQLGLFNQYACEQINNSSNDFEFEFGFNGSLSFAYNKQLVTVKDSTDEFSDQVFSQILKSEINYVGLTNDKFEFKLNCNYTIKNLKIINDDDDFTGDNATPSYHRWESNMYGKIVILLNQDFTTSAERMMNPFGRK